MDSKLGALILKPQLLKLKERMDPSTVNGAVLLGINGLVVKSHGGADAKGIASAIDMAASLAGKPFHQEVAETTAMVFSRTRNEFTDAPRLSTAPKPKAAAE